MACLDMYNSEQHNNNHHHCAPSMSPRISFSSDFVDLQQAIKQQQQDQRSSTTTIRSEAASSSSSDFEFSVTDYSMMSADELFFKGRFLPYKDNHNQMMQQRAPTTLRQELLVDDDDEDEYHQQGGFSLRPPKSSSSSSSSTRWKGLLGLRKSSHIGGNSKKAEKSEGSSSDRRGEARRRSALANEGGAPFNMITSQELFNEGGSSCNDMDSGI